MSESVGHISQIVGSVVDVHFETEAGESIYGFGDLTLEYNKGRQQKITAEILDLIGGTSE